MAIDYTTALGRVRLLTADVDETSPVLDDAQVSGFLALHGITDPTVADAPLWEVKRAAADALSTIATSEALIGKVIRTEAGVSTDGAKLAAELRAQAQVLRAQADTDQAAAAEADEPVLEVAEFHPWRL